MIAPQRRPRPVASPAPPVGRMPFPAARSISWGAVISALYIFVLNSRASEVFGLHKIRLAAILMLAALLAAGARFLLGNMRFSTVGKGYLALTALFLFSSALGVWPGGSAEAFGQWIRSVALFFAITYTAVSLRDARVVSWAVILGFLFLGVYTFRYGGGVAGRLGGGTSTGDPNYVAMAMIYAIPFAAFLALRSGMLGRLVALGAIPTLLAVFALTGSRGGLIGFGIMLAAWFLWASMRTRVLLAGGAVATISLAFVLLPGSILNRYTTLLSAQQEDGSRGDEVAAASGQARMHLFIRSLELSVRHPVLGVGLGMFSVAEDQAARDDGARKGVWHETHNMYTQVSSENGLPAVALYIFVLVLTLRNLNQVRWAGLQSRDPDIRQAGEMAYWIRLSLIGVMGAGLFLSIAYAGYIPILAALGVVLHRIAIPAPPPPGLAVRMPLPRPAR